MTQDSTRYQAKLQRGPPTNMSKNKTLPELSRDVDMVINKGIGDEKHERFCRAVLLSLVQDSIQDNIITIRPCHAIYTWLKHHYFTITRSSQCVAFNKLLSIEIRDDKAPSSLVMRMNEALTEFKNRSENLGDDYVMGQLLQRAIIKRPTIYRAVMDRLDAEVSCGKTTTFASCVLNLESCFQRPEANDIQPSFNSIKMTARPDFSEKEEHTALRSTMQLICHTCNKDGHIARYCPELLGQKTNTATPTNNAFRPMMTLPQYHAHYPIITPPVPFPFNSFHQPYQSKAPQQPDLYRPCYQQKPIAGVKACTVKIGNPNAPESSISVEDVADPGDRQSVYDTGASQSLTGDLSALCLFKKLTKPIPLCVATNTAQRSYVTGVGSLIYPGYLGKQVIINGVFYSPDAAGTLISPGALISTGAKLHMIGPDILISTEAEGPLLWATYCGNGWKWQLPMFSRLLARAIDKNDINLTQSNGCMPKESISTIMLPRAPISAMHTRPERDLKQSEPYTDNLDYKKELLQWHCLF
ncbi:hypothetical protein O181_025334 [Austropuccinia psidii MF-1]|uniref:CCHC-type domain-containing protein n=1 Tax=Austropuccinia psidii MF-1 TaxID=1389203 RepID=A0A9Q3H0J0_9BASI|nr:hypothetical protein [Austropuccinia psidii MF-1]